MQVCIRREQSRDITIIHALHTAAFGRRDEADIVDDLRAGGALWLSHVAECDGEIVGHATYSPAIVANAAGEHHFLALGPIGVLPRWQRRGIGAALIEAGFQAVSDAGFGLLFLVGHTDYYPRFGFQPALPLGFTSDYVTDPKAHEHFMVKVFNPRLIGEVNGHFSFHTAFADS